MPVNVPVKLRIVLKSNRTTEKILYSTTYFIDIYYLETLSNVFQSKNLLRRGETFMTLKHADKKLFQIILPVLCYFI